MVKIRLRRMGAKKAPYYRIVVADSRSPRDGRFIEEIGTYDPLSESEKLKVDLERAKYWIANGAQPTDLSLIHICSPRASARQSSGRFERRQSQHSRTSPRGRRRMSSAPSRTSACKMCIRDRFRRDP